MKRGCDVAGCDGNYYARGLCGKHYERFRLGRDPHTPSLRERSLEERFLAKLGPKDPVTGCIEWMGAKLGRGYGSIKRDGATFGAHRLAWELKHGPAPEGMNVLHSCDNPPCCNEEHLFLGTDQDNADDKVAKGRQFRPQGEKHYRAKLTDKDVLAIRQLSTAGKSLSFLAAEFGVSVSTISLIRTRKIWSHLK
jgi:hypothetical protein